MVIIYNLIGVIYMDIGTLIREARRMNGFTQIDLANRVSISVNSLRLYEANKRAPSFETLVQIADATGCYATDFVDYGSWDFIKGEMNRAGVTFEDVCDEMGMPLDVLNKLLSSATDSLVSQKVKHVATLMYKEVKKKTNRGFTTPKEKQAKAAFDKLNDKGQSVAIERIEELAKISEYCKEK